MRVLMTADSIGGVWNYALELCAALEQHQVQVVLATMGGPLADDQRAAAADIPNLQLVESHYRLCWMAEPWEDVRRAGTWLLALAKYYKPNVIHLNDYAHGDLPWQTPVLMVGHSCVLSWWKAVYRQPAPAEWHRYRHAVSAGLQAADLVVAPTATMLAALREFYGPLARCRVIFNGRDPQRYRPAHKDPLVLTAGRLWDEAKNLDAVAEIAPRLPWPVYVAGQAQHPDGGQTPFAGVHWLGRLPSTELAAWLGRAAIYALPARYEPFGLSVLEAALAGCALVLGDIPSLREVWEDAALFVPPDDSELLGATLRNLIAQEPLRAHYAVKARTRAAALSASSMAERYYAAYQQLLQTRRESGLYSHAAALGSPASR